MHTNTLPTGEILLRQEHASSSLCPHCGQHKDVTHILLCPHPDAQLCWQAGIHCLDCWLMTHSTSLPLHQAIISGLTQWHNPTALITTSLSPTIQECYQSQRQIGWNQFLLGFIANHWIILEQAYLESIASQRTGFQWGC